MAFWMGAGAAGLSGLGSLASSAFQAQHADQAASKGRRFAYHMATHQYQHAVKDMKKAGINPMLAAKVGGNAAPPGPTAPGITPGNPAAAALDAKQQAQQIANARETQNLIKAQAAKTLEEGRLTSANADQAEVVKGLYNVILPFVKDAQGWVNDQRNQPSFLERMGDWFSNSAKSVGDFFRERKEIIDNYNRGRGTGNTTHRLKPVKVKGND